MTTLNDPLQALRDFVIGMTHLIERTNEEASLLLYGRELLAALLKDDAWLPAFCAQPSPERYQQYLLHCDPLERFSVVSFVWEPGQQTPIHDHTVWGLIGVLRGVERSRAYVRGDGNQWVPTTETVLMPGQIDAVSPTIGDVHQVANASPDQTTVSIHVYGANIGAVRRHAFDATTGAAKEFISGYNSAQVPNLWSRGGLAAAGRP